MASYKTGPFGRRLPTPPPEDVTVQDIFPPSREERMQTMWMYGTVVIAVVVLGLGLLLRYTVFADRFKPQGYTPPAVASPEASPTAAPMVSESTPVPTSTPVVATAPAPAKAPAVVAPPMEKTSDGEPIAPSLSETGGRPVTPH